MSEQIVQVADASPSTKNMRTIQQTAGGNTVQSEVVVLATGAANGGDTYDARQIRALASTDTVTVQGQASLANWVGVELTSDATNKAFVTNSQPASNSYALAVRPIPGATQTVTLAAGATIGVHGDSTATPVLIGDLDAGVTLTAISGTTTGFGEAMNVTPIGAGNAYFPQETSTNELQVVLHTGTTGIDPRQTRTLTSADAVAIKDPSSGFSAAINNQGQQLVSIPTFQSPKLGWGPGWGNFQGW